MSLRDDFKRPIDEIENVYLRRGVLIITSLVMIPVLLVAGIFTAIIAVVWQVGIIIPCWWRGEKDPLTSENTGNKIAGLR